MFVGEDASDGIPTGRVAIFSDLVTRSGGISKESGRKKSLNLVTPVDGLFLVFEQVVVALVPPSDDGRYEGQSGGDCGQSKHRSHSNFGEDLMVFLSLKTNLI